MMNKMVVANLVHRPTRSLITTSAIALEVTMILLVVALFYGLLNGSKESQTGAEVCDEALGVILGRTASGADLGGSSKHSNENFED